MQRCLPAFNAYLALNNMALATQEHSGAWETTLTLPLKAVSEFPKYYIFEI